MDQYNSFNYKCCGSLVIWSLRHNLHDALTVWFLAQQYDRNTNKPSNRPTGIISDVEGFLRWLSNEMKVNRKVTKGRFNKAVRWGFFEDGYTNNHPQYAITGHRKMLTSAMNIQLSLNEKCMDIVKPIKFVAGDREYTNPLSKWICPHDMDKTKVLLAGIVMVQCNILGRGYENQAKLINKSRRTMLRRAKLAPVRQKQRYIAFDPDNLVCGRTCDNNQTIDAFMEAEKTYRGSGEYLPGRKFFQKHFSPQLKKTFLVVQISNQTTQDFVKEVPANRGNQHWKRCNEGLVRARCIRDTELGDFAEDHCRDSYPPIRTTRKMKKFTASGNLGVDQIPAGAFKMASYYLEEIMWNQEGQDKILSLTGAKGLVGSMDIEPIGLVDSGVSPFFRRIDGFNTSRSKNLIVS